MIKKIRSLFTAPVFPFDEEKTRTAKVLNSLVVSFFMVLVANLLAIPFLFAQKINSFLFVSGFFIILILVRSLILRGKVRQGSILFIAAVWLLVTVFVFLSGGMTSVTTIFYITITVMAGLLLGFHGIVTVALLSSLAGLGMVSLSFSSFHLQRIFPVPPPAGWLDMTVALFLVTMTLSIALRSLEDALAAAKQQLEEREKAERALYASTEKIQAMFQSATDGIVFTELDGTILDLNVAAIRLSGYHDRAALVGSNVFDFISEGDRALVKTQIQETLATGYSGLFEASLRRKSGEIINGEFSAILLKNEQGDPTSLVGILRDITDRVQARQLEDAVYHIAQAAIQADGLDDLYSEIFTIISGVMAIKNFYIALYDQKQCLLSFPFFVDEMDLPPEPSPLGKGLTEYVLRTGLSLLCDQNLHLELEQRGEIELVGTASPIWLGVPLKLDQDVLGVMVLQDYRDPQAFGHREQRILEYVSSQVAEVIARQRAEDALQTSENRYRAIIEDQTEFIVRWLPDGTRTFVNESYCRYLGQSAAQLIGSSFFPLLTETDRELVKRKQRELRPEDDVVTYEERLIFPDGTIHWLHWTDRGLFDAQGDLREIQSVGNDITEQRFAQEQILRQINRLASLRAIDMAITTSVDLHVTLDVLLQQTIAQLEIDAATILLLDFATQCFDHMLQRGLNFVSSVQNFSLRLNETIAGQVVLERRTVQIASYDQIDSSLKPSYLEAEGFATYFGVPLIAKGKVKGVLEIFHRTPISPEPDWLNFLESLAGQAAIAIDNAELFTGLERSNLELTLAYNTTLEGWAKALEMRDVKTVGHSQRVTDLTVKLGRALGIREESLGHIYRGALLHDIGKMGIPDQILLKPGPLTEAEWEIMRLHPVYAYKMLSPIQYLRPAIDIPYYHHEKWDGSGYPQGLKGAQIPLAARVFSIVDVWDALCSDRPYRLAWTPEQALAYIDERAGIEFDPAIVDVFQKII